MKNGVKKASENLVARGSAKTPRDLPKNTLPDTPGRGRGTGGLVGSAAGAYYVRAPAARPTNPRPSSRPLQTDPDGENGRSSARPANRKKRKAETNGKPTEVWKRVPGTPYVYLVSNLGHLLHVSDCHEMTPGGDTVPTVTDETKNLWCSLRGAKFGWFMFVDADGEKFFERDGLMRLFDGIPVEVDTSRDAAAAELRKELILGCEAEIATSREEDIALNCL